MNYSNCQFFLSHFRPSCNALKVQRGSRPLVLVAPRFLKAGRRLSLYTASAMAEFPTPAERNRRLARRLKEAAGSNDGYIAVKSSATLFRAGKLSAEDLCAVFFSILGHSSDAEALYLEMAELLPTPNLYGDLMLALQNFENGPSDESPGNQQQGAGLHPGVTQPTLQTSGPGTDTFTSGPKPPSTTPSAPPPQANKLESLPGLQQRENKHTSSQMRQHPESLLLQLSGVHPNSLSSRPAKSITAAKRPRSVPAKDGVAGGREGIVVWLRQDLRLHDNQALCAACADAAAAGAAVTLLFIHSPAEDGESPAADEGSGSWRPGAASLLWLHCALDALDRDLRQRYGQGAAVVYRRGPAAAALLDVAGAVGAGKVYATRRYEPAMKACDEAVGWQLESSGVRLRLFGGYLLREPEDVRLDMGKWMGHFGTLMPFYRACEALGAMGKPLPPPARLPVAPHAPGARCGGVSLADLGLARMPVRRDGTVVDWGAPIRRAWGACSEEEALQMMEGFIAVGLKRYEADRGFADGRCVSRLSPYLHWGQLSPRLLMARLRQANCKQVSKTFWRRLVWRDLAYWQLHHWPAMALRPIREHYERQAWRDDPAALRAWQRGMTGFPLVDAGMRQLWATGWMQQNARMAAACLLTEYLNIHWREGARWFHHTLVDADLAINSMMWQNAGKSGLDQWNFTVLPTSKSQDPDGSFVRRWVPELRSLPNSHILQPWAAPPATLKAAGVELGVTYPHRITTQDFQELRGANTAAIRAAREAGGAGCKDHQGYDLITVPQGATLGHDGKRMRVFTKPEYRGTGGGGGGSSTPALATSRVGGQAGPRGRGARSRVGDKAGGKLTAHQRTLEEYMSRSSS